MKYNIRRHLLAFGCLAIAAFIVGINGDDKLATGHYIFHTVKGDFQYLLYEAKTEAQKARGLQEVYSLPYDCGMIFYFDGGQKTYFWMKNAYLALDLIYLDQDMRVTSIKANRPALSENIINEGYIAHYVIELLAFEAKRIGLEIGDKVSKLGVF